MLQFKYYLDKTFKAGTTLEESKRLRRLLKEGKPVKQFLNPEPTSIYLGVTIGGKYIKVNTRERIAPVHWDGRRQSAKPSHPTSFELNADLGALKTKVELAYRNAIANNPDMRVGQVKELIQNVIMNVTPKQDLKGFFEAWEEFTEEKKKMSKVNTMKRYGTTKGHLLDFHTNNYKLTYEKITKQFGDDLTYFLCKGEMLNNSIAKIIVCTKVFIRWAIEKKYTDVHDFLNYKVKNDATDIIHLTEQELLKLFLMSFNNKSLEKARDVFSFQCFTGQRYSDIKNLRWNDLKKTEDGWEWHLYQIKGNKSKKTVVPLSSKAVSILEKYPCFDKDINSTVLPVSCDQVMNQRIKEICRLADFNERITLVKYSGKSRIEIEKKKWELISTHSARRTFVTISWEKKMPLEVIKSITGHEDIKTLLKYLKVMDSVKKAEFKDAWE